MRIALVIFVVALVAPVRLPRAPTPVEPKPYEEILGDWQLESLEHGNPRMAHAVTNCVLRITPTETLFMVAGKVSEADGLTATYTIDWSRGPAFIDLMPKQRGGKIPGILMLEGDRLTFAITTSGDQRPADFPSAQMVGHYKRVGK